MRPTRHDRTRRRAKVENYRPTSIPRVLLCCLWSPPRTPVLQDEEAACSMSSSHDFDYYLATDWMKAGACRGRTDINFFPNKSDSDLPAKALCSTCPVLEPCYQYAVADPTIVGIWAGTSTRGRMRIRVSIATGEPIKKRHETSYKVRQSRKVEDKLPTSE